MCDYLNWLIYITYDDPVSAKKLHFPCLIPSFVLFAVSSWVSGLFGLSVKDNNLLELSVVAFSMRVSLFIFYSCQSGSIIIFLGYWFAKILSFYSSDMCECFWFNNLVIFHFHCTENWEGNENKISFSHIATWYSFIFSCIRALNFWIGIVEIEDLVWEFLFLYHCLNLLPSFS